jgi:hypothetical protein
MALELEYVHGYQGQTSRNNLRYNAQGEMLFHAANMGIVYNRQYNSQRFYSEHDAGVLSLDVSTDGQMVVTGQAAGVNHPLVRIWDAATCNTLAALPAFHRRGMYSYCTHTHAVLILMLHSYSCCTHTHCTHTHTIYASHSTRITPQVSR